MGDKQESNLHNPSTDRRLKKSKVLKWPHPVKSTPAGLHSGVEPGKLCHCSHFIHVKRNGNQTYMKVMTSSNLAIYFIYLGNILSKFSEDILA